MYFEEKKKTIYPYESDALKPYNKRDEKFSTSLFQAIFLKNEMKLFTFRKTRALRVRMFDVKKNSFISILLPNLNAFHELKLKMNE